MTGGYNMNIKRILKLWFLAFFLFLTPLTVLATGTATTGFSGNDSVYVGNNIEVILYVGNVSGTTNNEGLAAFGGNLTYSTDKLELISSSSLGPFSVELVGNKIGGFGQNTIKGNTNILKLVFKTKALGTATISYSGSNQPDSYNSPVSISGCTKTINIVNPPSSNNNLSNLSVSSGGINFDKNITNYNISVEPNITNFNIQASAEDNGASISGVGTKTLNYGNNSFNIVVTAPNGAKKTYTVNVNRKDNRSGNNNLSNLKVNGGDLKPGFSKSNTNYTLEVPYSISNLTVNASTEDSKAYVTVTGNNNLIAETTNQVTITVTAENGSKKTYTISVKRGKDPNKILSTNNYLTHLKPSIGILSPVFDKNNNDYEIWLPYEIDKISFDYQVDDKKYATIKFEGKDTLQPGVSNIYKIIVTAESGDERIYKINVRRAKNPAENTSSNTYLKSIKLKNGNLTTKFDKESHEYFYTSSKGFEITEVVPDDENSIVIIVEEKNTFYLIVSSSSGDYGVYTLRPKNLINYFIYVLLFICGAGLGVVLTVGTSKIKKKTEAKKSK